MSKKANPTAIGIFVVAAALLGVLSVVVFDSSGLFRKKEYIVMYFEESVNGLDIGAPLKFKGVRIGQVTKIYLDFNQNDEHSSIPVVAEIDVYNFRENLGAKMDIGDPVVLRRMIEEDGLRARLQQASFVTGLLFIELNYHRDAPKAVFVQQEGIFAEKNLPEVPTMRGNMARMLQDISITLNKLGKLDLVGISNKTNQILDKVDGGISQIEFNKINEQLVGTLENLNRITGNEQLHEAVAQIGPLFEAVHKTVEGLEGATGQLGQVSARVDSLLADDSPLIYQFYSVLQELSRTLTSLRVLSDYLERNPSSLFLGKQEKP